jgi:XRE family aerobic/anaerobic benzoate catabolism transcriptional regulator
MRHDDLLIAVGEQVRQMRHDQHLSRKQLAKLSGVSERFLAQLEVGQGNISLRRFADVAEALNTSPSALLSAATNECSPRNMVALLGVRGAGKSTVGHQLAERFKLPFVEVDTLIERTAGLELGEIFELHGEAYYRRLEQQVLEQIVRPSGAAMILATGGSIVTNASNYALLAQHACTVWLAARAEDHWNRVVQQGDARPMAENPHAFAELRTLLETRAPLYRQAHHTVDTTDKSIAEVVDLVAQAAADALPDPAHA